MTFEERKLMLVKDVLCAIITSGHAREESFDGFKTEEEIKQLEIKEAEHYVNALLIHLS